MSIVTTKQGATVYVSKQGESISDRVLGGYLSGDWVQKVAKQNGISIAKKTKYSFAELRSFCSSSTEDYPVASLKKFFNALNEVAVEAKTSIKNAEDIDFLGEEDSSEPDGFMDAVTALCESSPETFKKTLDKIEGRVANANGAYSTKAMTYRGGFGSLNMRSFLRAFATQVNSQKGDLTIRIAEDVQPEGSNTAIDVVVRVYKNKKVAKTLGFKYGKDSAGTTVKGVVTVTRETMNLTLIKFISEVLVM